MSHIGIMRGIIGGILILQREKRIPLFIKGFAFIFKKI